MAQTESIKVKGIGYHDIEPHTGLEDDDVGSEFLEKTDDNKPETIESGITVQAIDDQGNMWMNSSPASIKRFREVVPPNA